MKLLDKPKIIIPIFFVLAVIVGVVSYRFIGQTPVVTLSDSSTSTVQSESTINSVDLSFPKSGRLAEVSVVVGSQVKKGDTIASLDAGDSLGAVNQTKGALELAKAQYASLNVQYANAKLQQDTLVSNAHRTLLSSGLSAVAKSTDTNTSASVVDNNSAPQISGTYTCDKEGSYEIAPYASGATSGYSFLFSGLEQGTGNVAYYTSQTLGSCGLYILFPVGYSSSNVKWVVNIPNMKSSGYAANKNAYDLAVATRDQVLNQLEANLGKNGSSDANVAQASVDAAQGAYQAALAAYKNNLIIAPIDGVVTFLDSHLKIGQSVTANKTVITIANK